MIFNMVGAAQGGGSQNGKMVKASSDAEVLNALTAASNSGAYIRPIDSSYGPITLNPNESFEICLTFEVTRASGHTHSMQFLGTNRSGGSGYLIMSGISADKSEVNVYISSSGSTWQSPILLDLSQPLQIGGTYTVIISGDGASNITVSLSDGTNTDTTTQAIGTCGNPNSSYLIFGRAESASGLDYTFDIGSFILDKCYIKKQGVTVW